LTYLPGSHGDMWTIGNLDISQHSERPDKPVLPANTKDWHPQSSREECQIPVQLFKKLTPLVT